MSDKTDKSGHIDGTHVFTGQQSMKGFKLNRFAYSLNHESNRNAYKDDPLAYMESYGLSQWEKERVLELDYKKLVEEGGGNIYMLIKVGAVAGAGLATIGAQQRGETLEEFMKTRNVRLPENE